MLVVRRLQGGRNFDTLSHVSRLGIQPLRDSAMSDTMAIAPRCVCSSTCIYADATSCRKPP